MDNSWQAKERSRVQDWLGAQKWDLKLATFATDLDEISFGFIPQKRTHRGWGGQQRRRERRGAPRRWGRKLQKCSQLPSPLESHLLSISVSSSTQMAMVRTTHWRYYYDKENESRPQKIKIYNSPSCTFIMNTCALLMNQSMRVFISLTVAAW